MHFSFRYSLSRLCSTEFVHPHHHHLHPLLLLQQQLLGAHCRRSNNMIIGKTKNYSHVVLPFGATTGYSVHERHEQGDVSRDTEHEQTTRRQASMPRAYGVRVLNGQ
jgi:hypothetical protein